MRYIQNIFHFIIIVLILTACKKQPGNNPAITSGLSYGDSIFYVKNQSYVVNPQNPRTGTYTAFPENLLIDNTTGAITVKIIGKGLESQTGLRYKIKYQSADGSVTDSTYIVLAGINYLDRIYYLSQHDTIIYPIYNAKLSNGLPSGTYGIDPDNDLSINPANGQINIKECIRRGLFDIPVENGEWEEVSVEYKSNDNSNNVTNRIDIALYYYDRLSDVPSNISTVMRAHQTMVLGIAQPEIPQTFGPIDNDLPDNLSIFRPRPPCIIIIAN